MVISRLLAVVLIGWGKVVLLWSAWKVGVARPAGMDPHVLYNESFWHTFSIPLGLVGVGYAVWILGSALEIEQSRR